MTTAEVAKGLVEMCQQGKNNEAMSAYYAPEIMSYEAAPSAPVAEGIAAVQGKAAWWDSTMEVHSAQIVGPFINADQFAVRFTYDVTDKTTNRRSTLDEIAVYRVRDGKIIEERFLYAADMLAGMAG